MSTTNQQKFLNQTPIQQGLIGNFHRQFLATLVSVQPTSILELGCGEGYLLNKIHQQLPATPMLGLDTLAAALQEGHHLFPGLKLESGDIYHIHQPDASWDVTIASEVLEHLDDPKAAIRELKRVTKRYVLLSVPNEPWFRLGNFARGRHVRRFGNHPEHINMWTKKKFSRFVGHELTIEKSISAFPWTIVLARK